MDVIAESASLLLDLMRVAVHSLLSISPRSSLSLSITLVFLYEFLSGSHS